MLRRIDYGIGWLSRLCSRVGVVIMVCMALLLVVNVGLRVFATPILGVIEIAGYAMLALIMLALPYTHRTDSHIRIHLITERFPFRVRTLVEAGAQFLTAVVTLWIAYMYLEATLNGGRTTATGLIEIPTLPFRLLVILGFGLWGLEAVAGMVKALSGSGSREPPVEPEALVDEGGRAI